MATSTLDEQNSQKLFVYQRFFFFLMGYATPWGRLTNTAFWDDPPNFSSEIWVNLDLRQKDSQLLGGSGPFFSFFSQKYWEFHHPN